MTAFSVGLTAAALVGFSFSDSFWMLCLWAIPYGLGAGAVDAGRLVSSQELKKAQDLTVVVPDSSKLFKAFKDNIEAAMAGNKSAKQALDDIVKVWNASL